GYAIEPRRRLPERRRLRVRVQTHTLVDRLTERAQHRSGRGVRILVRVELDDATAVRRLLARRVRRDRTHGRSDRIRGTCHPAVLRPGARRRNTIVATSRPAALRPCVQLATRRSGGEVVSSGWR